MADGDNAGNDTATGTAAGTFTQADLDRAARAARKAEAEKYADYNDLKAKAAQSDQAKSAMDQLLEKVSGLEKRAAAAEAAALRADVATAKKLPAWMAKRLQGKTREELEADADEMLTAMKPSDDGKAGDGKTGEGDASKTGDGKTGEGDGKASDAGKGDGKRALPPSGRPTEKLTPGAVPATGSDVNPAELAKSILSNPF